VAFSLSKFTNGSSTLVAIDEMRAGIHPVDPRGTWALGQIAASATWGHGVNGDDYGPNNQWSRSDDIVGCPRLHETVGTATLEREKMPCVSYLDQNTNATARSRHDGGVNVVFVDGAAKFISDRIDPSLWHAMHSRETPREMLSDAIDDHGSGGNGVTDRTVEDASLSSRSVNPPTVLKNSLGMEFARIPAGEYTMGVADRGNDGNVPAECPPHHVRITQVFYMGRYEVTQHEYRLIMQANPSFHQRAEVDDDINNRLPVEQITWFDACEFCHRLSALSEECGTRRRYRLPTEAEWEYGCRAGSSDPYHWRRNRPARDRSGEAAGIEPALPITPVGSFRPNAFGLFDMRGNVWEWCSDWFDRDYYARSPVDNPQGPDQGFIKVVRGADWTFIGEVCKINFAVMPPWKSNPYVGFRIVCDSF